MGLEHLLDKDEQGDIKPLVIIEDDGWEFEIDRILDVKNCASWQVEPGESALLKLAAKFEICFNP